MCVLEPDGTILEAAAGAVGDMCGRGLWDCPLWDDPAAAGPLIRETCAEAGRSGCAQSTDVRLKREPPEEIELHVFPLAGAGGRLVAIGMSVTRKTEEALRAADRRFHELVRTAPEPIYEIDFRTRRFVSVNDACCALLGYLREELLAMDPFAIVEEPDAERSRRRIERWLRGEEPERNVQYAVRTRAGDRLDVELNVSFTTGVDGRPLGALVFAHDVTTRALAVTEACASRDAFESMAQSLEERVRERTADLERRTVELRILHAELSRAEQRERRRLASLLHDGLQQLLVAAKIRVALARRPGGDSSPVLLEEIHGLLNDSIEAARSLTIELSPPLLHDRGLVPALHWLAREMGEKQGLAVEVIAPDGAKPEAEDVRLLLFQAARELLFNVAKHAGKPEAMVRLERRAGWLRLDVVDQGAGFEPDRARGEGTDSASFGLLSVEQRVEWLGGSMEIDSAPGRGTRVSLLVPLTTSARAPATAPARALPAEPLPAAIAAGGGARVRVLLADDHKIVREGLAALLSGVAELDLVGQAADGVEAVERARALRPDVVVMDLSMPRMDGIEATRRITSELPGVRVVGLSMHDSPEVTDAMRAAGAIGYVRKGAPLENLVEIVLGRRSEPEAEHVHKA